MTTETRRMRVLLVTGGVRSGKSRWAQDTAARLGSQAVTVVATAEAVDDEMADRIEAHRRHRPEGWETLEAPSDAGAAIQRASHEVVVLDCMTVLLGAAIGKAHADSEHAALEAMSREVDGILEAVDRRTGTLIVVTNEVGSSVHPPTALGRWFIDGLGAANQRLAGRADKVVLMVSGFELQIK